MTSSAKTRSISRLRAWWGRRSFVAKGLLLIVGIILLANAVYWGWFGVYVLVTTIQGPTAD